MKHIFQILYFSATIYTPFTSQVYTRKLTHI